MTFRDLYTVFFTDTPVELYKFTLGGAVWGFVATCEENYVFDGITFVPEYIVRTGLHYSSDFARDVLTVTLPAYNAVAATFFTGTPEYQVKLSVLRGGYHGGGFAQIWSGTVNGASFDFSGEAYTCDLSCETLAAKMERQGLSRCYQLTCPHTLYGERCRLDQGLFAVGTAVLRQTSAIDLSLAASYPDGYFAGGHLVRNRDGSRRYIVTSSGTAIRMERSLHCAPGEGLTLYPGCDKTRDTCCSKFNNGVNFGGFPWLPTENPFTSSIG